MGSSRQPLLRRLNRIVFITLRLVVGASIAATLIYFPWNTDPQGDETGQSRRYYEQAYSSTKSASHQTPPSEIAPLSAKEQYYVDFARDAARKFHVPEEVGNFIRKNGLERKKVLEVGAGSGLLQDVVDDYTGLDISPTARRFFHKPFVEASATQMPFPDSSFDGLFSIWVLEHIPNPEKALLEMRRVVKPGGYIFLMPAVDVSRYAAQGYRVRPYSDFGWKGKLIKATLPVTGSPAWHVLQRHQVRALRWAASHLGSGPTRLHFVRLTPNYDQFWEADSDAAISVSSYELYLWFASRGDRFVDPLPEWSMVLADHDYHLTVHVSK